MVNATIYEHPVDVSVVAPEAVMLRCQVAGQPLPQIMWIRELSNGTMTEFTMSTDNINITETIDVLNKTVTSVLIIQPTSALDTARFRCRAQNQLSVSINIVVYTIEVQVNIYGM